MKVYGASAYDIDRVVHEVSHDSYDGNLILKSVSDCSNSRGARSTFTLQVLDSHAGQRGAIGRPSSTGKGPNGLARRIGACWHAHWDVIAKLFERFPQARLTSGFRLRGVAVTYTADTFEQVARQTAHLNVGTGWEPVTMPQCCECDHSRYCPDAPGAQAELSALPSAPQSTHPALYDPADPWGGPVPDLSASHANASSPNTRVPYLGGLPAARPATRPSAEDTLAKIDKVLSE